MITKKELCEELIKFAKIKLGSEFNIAYLNDDECSKDFERVLDSNPKNVILEVDDAITDLLLFEDMENDDNQKTCEYFLKLAYKLNVYNKYFKEKKVDEEKDI